MSDVCWENAPDWADKMGQGANSDLDIWFNDYQYSYFGDELDVFVFGDKDHICRSLDSMVVIEMRPGKWKEGEERMEPIMQNGNDGGHYTELEANKTKYQREIKKGVFVDVYDVLLAFGVTNPAMQHAIKKMLAPGQRGVKDAIQDMNEAMQSIERAKELESIDEMAFKHKV